MTEAAIEPRFRIKGWHVLLGFVAFFGVVIAVDTGFIIMSVRSFPGQVSVTPYEDGLVYDRKLAQVAAQERLGWRASAAAEPGAVVVAQTEPPRTALTGPAGTRHHQPPPTQARRLTHPIQEAGPGHYVARPGGLAGAWDLTAVAFGARGERFEAERRLTWR